MIGHIDKDETGFTLIEILVVCVVLGILVAVAVPYFLAQRKSAVETSLVADVRNAAMEMEKEAVLSPTGYAPEIPDTFYRSDGNVVVIDSSVSSANAYCIIGTNKSYEDLFYYYHSDHRKVTPNMETCGFKPIEDMGPLPLTPSDTPEDTDHDHPEHAPGLPQNPPPGAGTIIAPPPPGYDNPKKQKYKICHSNGKALELPLPAIVNGHSGHGADIIPAIPGKFTGQNWTPRGAEIWENDCQGMDNTDYMG